MLAIKNVLASKDNIQTLIFDEVDTGVSGRAAQKIAEKLSYVSKNRQVLCVTHLSQIAAMADTHFLIEKNVIDDITKTKVISLNKDARINEIARIIGGAEITSNTLLSAKDMLVQAEMYKG